MRVSQCRSTLASQCHRAARERRALSDPARHTCTRHPSVSREAVVAEKLHALVALGERTSRMKDFYDLHALASQFRFDGASLSRAISATFERRRTKIDATLPSALTPRFYSDVSRAANGAPTSPAIVFPARLLILRRPARGFEVSLWPRGRRSAAARCLRTFGNLGDHGGLHREQIASSDSDAGRAGSSRIRPTRILVSSGFGRFPAWKVKRTKFAARLRSGHTPSRQHPEYCRTAPFRGLAWPTCGRFEMIKPSTSSKPRRKSASLAWPTRPRDCFLRVRSSSRALRPSGSLRSWASTWRPRRTS